MRDKSKVIALVALVIAVVGLGIGFAAFSSQLTISSGATVTPNKSDWNVGFTSNVSCYTMGEGATIVSQPTINGTTVSGIEVAFSQPGPGLICSLEIANTGKYRAYLTKMEFIEDSISCEALEESDANFPEGYTRADDDLVATACEGITAFFRKNPYNMFDIAEITIPSSSYYNSSWTINDIPENQDILNYSINMETSGTFQMGITYNSTAAIADGPFVVKIPDIKLTFSTTPTVQ